MIAQFLSHKPPPINVSVAEAKSETIPNLLTAVGELVAVHQVNVTSDVSGRITDIMFTAGSGVKSGTPLVQLYDAPEQGDLANFKAQATVAQLSLDRAKKLLAESHYKLEVLARMCGYQSANSFCVAFKQTTGFSPKQFRGKLVG